MNSFMFEGVEHNVRACLGKPGDAVNDVPAQFQAEFSCKILLRPALPLPAVAAIDLQGCRGAAAVYLGIGHAHYW